LVSKIGPATGVTAHVVETILVTRVHGSRNSRPLGCSGKDKLYSQRQQHLQARIASVQPAVAAGSASTVSGYAAHKTINRGVL